jgi:Dyp-type peroxidase family
MLQLDDIQGNLLRAYDLPFARYVFLRIADAAKGREWLGRVIDSVTSVAEWDGKPRWTFNVAFSFSGLQALGLPAETASFPDAFRAGMAERATILGDTGPSDPVTWQFGKDPATLHALVAIHAQSEVELKFRYAWHEEMLQTAASPMFVRCAASLRGGTEHFGYRDGFGQPDVQHSGEPACPGRGTPNPAGGWNSLALGEFVLGYEDETGRCEPMPNPDVLGRNGSYMVVRMLRQNVAAFRDFLRRGAEIGRDPEWLAARMVGRWRSGAPLVLAPNQDNPQLADDPVRNNDFRYKGDLKGLLCPRNAHIRRVNPRDAMDGDPNVTVSRHRILRRGTPYGSPLPLEAQADDGVDRGIIFIAVNASITRQFEYIQKIWVNDGDFIDGGQEKDPVIGNHEPDAVFTIPATPVSKCLKGLSSFVVTRGGGYFFLPGIKALRYLCRSQSP